MKRLNPLNSWQAGGRFTTLLLSSSWPLLLLTFIQHQDYPQHSTEHKGRWSSCFENKHLGSPTAFCPSRGNQPAAMLTHSTLPPPHDAVCSFSLSNFRSSGICLVLWGPVWVVWTYWPLWPKSGLKEWAEGRSRHGQLGRRGSENRQGAQWKEGTVLSHDWHVNQRDTSPRVSILPLQSLCLSFHP